MAKKPTRRLPLPPQPERREPSEDWHNGCDIEIDFYRWSLRGAAKKLMASLDFVSHPMADWDGCPVVLLYRQAMELYMKVLVGEGNRLLPWPTDPISLLETHSLQWLAQLVCQIIKAVQLEDAFRCNGVASLGDFTALVKELEALDPVALAVQGERDGSVPAQLKPRSVARLARRVESVLALLDATTDALAAARDQRVRSFSAGNCGSVQ